MPGSATRGKEGLSTTLLPSGWKVKRCVCVHVITHIFFPALLTLVVTVNSSEVHSVQELK